MSPEVMKTNDAKRRGGLKSKERFGGGKVRQVELEPCAKSPTGYHHYVIPREGVIVVGACKWCNAEQEHSNLSSFDQVRS